MESLAYVHLALAYETPAPTLRLKAWNFFKFFKKLKPKAPRLRPMLALLSLTIAASIITLAGNALALIQREDTGPQVTNLQQDLNKIGYYDGPFTQFFGSLTQEAVIRFQQDKGLDADGVVGSQTLAAIDRELGRTRRQTYNTPSINKTLKQGDSGPEVEELQRLLTDAGVYDGPIRGFYGPLTETAVIRYQQNRGLTPTGEADATTLAELQGRNSPIAPPPSTISRENPFQNTLKLGNTGSEVAELQRLLKELNYYTGPINGEFDSFTEAAVIRFQRNNGLKGDGIFGRETQRQLITAVNSGDSNDDRYSQSPYTVGDLQKRLKNKNLYSGPIDNNFGPQTKQAVQNAQDRYGVTSSDIRSRRY